MTEFPWTTDNYHFQYLKARWEKSCKDGLETVVDPLMVPLLPLFNRLPGVVTYMSCSSHPTRDPSFVWNSEGKRNGGRFYITFAVTSEGANHLIKFFEILHDTLDELAADPPQEAAKWFTRSCVTLIFTNQGEKANENQPDNQRWRGLRLKAELNRHDPDVLEYFLMVLSETLIHYTQHFVSQG